MQIYGAGGKGDGAHAYFELHRSGTHRFFQCQNLRKCQNLRPMKERDQITTSERPGRGLFSLEEVQTAGIAVSDRPPAHFSDVRL